MRHVSWVTALLLGPPRPQCSVNQRWHRPPTRLYSANTRNRPRAAPGTSTNFFVEIEDTDGELRKVHVLEAVPRQAKQPTLILVGGTAQTVASWVGHAQALAKERQLFVIETRGQGKTELGLEKATIEQHVKDFIKITEALADLCGFSFGGRVCLAVAALRPDFVRRLVLTGVPAERDALGRLIFKSWKSSLESGELKAFAWNSMLNTHAGAFLSRNEDKIPQWVDLVVQSNSCEAIYSILSQSHSVNKDDPFHPLQLAPRVTAPTLLLCGAHDRVAPPHEVQRLSSEGSGGRWPVVLLPESGHNCVFEEARAWRTAVLGFLDQPESGQARKD